MKLTGDIDTDHDRKNLGFIEDFKRFFLRGLAAVLPTLITLWLLLWAWDFLWNNIGQHLIVAVRVVWYYGVGQDVLPFQSAGYIARKLDEDDFGTRVLGVLLSVALIYIVGVFVGNLLGRTAWRVAESWLLRIPFVRAIYPSVKQVTDFILAERGHQFSSSRVVAVQPHAENIWSIGMVTSTATWHLDSGPQEMVTVFIPSTPTSITGYVLVVPREKCIELPMTVEDAMRLLVSGGVIMPVAPKAPAISSSEAPPTPAPRPHGGGIVPPAGSALPGAATDDPSSALLP